MRAEYDMSQAKRGAIINEPGKTRITLFLDNGIVKYFRHESEKIGKGYQTMINDCLNEAIHEKSKNPNAALRRIVREELKKALHN